MVEIDEQRHMVVAAARSGLVKADAADRAVIGAGAGLLHLVMDDAPKLRVVLTHHAGDAGHRHAGDQCHDEGFEQQRQATPRTRPIVRDRKLTSRSASPSG